MIVFSFFYAVRKQHEKNILMQTSALSDASEPRLALPSSLNTDVVFFYRKNAQQGTPKIYGRRDPFEAKGKHCPKVAARARWQRLAPSMQHILYAFLFRFRVTVVVLL